MSVKARRLGADGPESFPIAIGCAAMSGTRGQGPDDRESIATIQKAIDAGVNLVDTADFYGSGHNEMLIRKAIEGRRERVVLSVKFDGLRSPEGKFLGVDARPASVANYLAYSLTRLGTDYVDIYRPARLDPSVPIEETVGAIADLVKAGYVRHIGLSEMGIETVRRAHSVHPISDLHIEYSLMSRDPEKEIMPTLDELGIGMTAYGVLSHGLLSGTAKKAEAGDSRAHLPRLIGQNFDHNLQLVQALSEIAREKKVSTSQLAISWVLAKGKNIVPVVGSRKRTQIEDAVQALKIELSNEDLAKIERAVPAGDVAGTRYDEHLMKMLDSERKA